MMVRAALCLGLALISTLAEAYAPETSLRPVPRPGFAQQEAAREAGARALAQSLRPKPRTARVEREIRQTQRERRRGAVCGDLEIQGEPVGRVPGKLAGCGLSDAVRITSVSGIALSQSSVMDCRTAEALNRWVKRSARPALRRTGGGLARLKVAAHYSCRTRNNQPGAKISEHGKGRAIDISGFYLKDGTLLTVLDDWRGRHSQAMRKMHSGACGPFGTILGPNADRFHKDHFHFDTARHRGGAYCR